MTNAVNIAQIGSNNTTFRNRVINGAMVINQRGTSSVTTDGGYPVDRFLYGATQASKATVSQDTSVYPAGFNSSIKVLSSSAYTQLAGDYFFVQQAIEGYNIADLGWGAANAQTVTLSFWVRSSLTGTFGGDFRSTGGGRNYPFTYTISAANTWEQKSVTIAGDTSGTWLTTNGVGIYVIFGLGAGTTYSGPAGAWSSSNYIAATGATNILGTNAATWYVTGVQLEAGSAASPFEYRSYGTELALCQRYAFKRLADGSVNSYAPFGIGRYYTTTAVQLYVPFPVTMRTSPSSITVSGTIFANDTGFGGADITSPVLNESSCDGATITGGTTATGTAGYATTFYASNTSVASILFFAEL